MNDTELDPEIAALLSNAQSSVQVEEYKAPGDAVKLSKGFSKDEVNIYGTESAPKATSIHEVDLSKTCFEKIENKLLDTPASTYDDPKYYKITLTGENASAQRVHQILSKYLTCTDSKDRAVYRQQIVTAYWELLRGMAPKMPDPNLPISKKMLMRFGVLLPSLFKPEQKEFFSKVILENKYNEPVLYVDEWFKEIASGRMSNSATDEKKQVRTANMTAEQAASAEQARLMQLQSKNSGKLQSSENILNIKENERAMIETELKNRVDTLCDHMPIMGLEPHKNAMSETQRKLFTEITNLLHRLSKNDKELSKALSEYREAKGTYDQVQNKLEANGGSEAIPADTGAINTEFDTIRQMAKMTIGRRGNQFPLFTREFYHCTENGTGTRENVLDVLRWIESIDPGVFHRVHKNVPNRIVPYVLLVPTYGDRGFCWEPFDRYNRVTSRGRIVIPMYPRDLKIAVLTAVADLRWQVAKEKASYYWMEEGLTGQYYQHIEQMKIKGDLKEFFIEDYILWMTKESEGVQRLDKDVRGIFWRNMPFPKEKKEDLRKRSLVYDELCKKDANREMSDGY
ncbi:MAG: hypothetical protein MSH65_11545 [Spirochaetia bacterium]|nr:hypothetical protein [Spirochaetia bacterium]